MSKKPKQKNNSRKNPEPTIQKVILATVIIELISRVIDLITKLIE